MSTSMIQLRGVDLVKYVMSLGVITIHVGAVFDGDSTFPDIVVWWMRSAVPFFFITTGYLIARRSDSVINNSSYYIARAWQVYRIFIYWMLVYLPISVIIYWQVDYTLIKSVKSYIIGIFTYGQCPGAPLWYIYALGGFMLVMYVASRMKIGLGVITVWFVFIYMVSYGVSENLISTQVPMVKWFYLLTRRTFGGGIYILAGMALCHWNRLLTSYTAMLIAGFLSAILYVWGWMFWELLAGVFFFILALRLVLRQNDIWLYMRQQSMWIYYTHMIPIFIISQLYRAHGTEPSVVTFLVTAIVTTLLLTNLIYLMQRRYPGLSIMIK